MADSEQDTPPVEVEAGAFVPPSIHSEPLLVGQSYSHFSPVPPSLLPSDPSNPSSAVPCCLGVDEAGRGPVLGPMVYGVFYLPIDRSDELLREAHHFDDSKVLTAAVRADLMRTLCRPGSDLHDACGWATCALSARDIGAGMLRPVGAYNLNAQAMDATVDLIKGVYARGVNVQEIYVDTIGPPATYQAKLQRIFPTARVTVAKKADSLYACVSAASVCAKVTRDVALETLYGDRRDPADHEADGDEAMAWGSGYPSDGRCTAWLRGNLHPVFGWGPECRFSWGTAKDMLEAKGNGVKVEWPADDDGEASRVTDFFVSGDKDTNELGHWFGTPADLEAF
ncbi:ribonuclease HI large subunit [Cordyceps fumosorosea ARSEF 2679]|uniref:Ribonuclease n=1 Tax=Cordyceps fumosorosea (strain ARSEF 2679) TaxID=1081104 RepID=A0A167S558_CORFA|nr:ribonuclease HI large subunit [Cordyceps fumosorosea ARSEF 2679]OAA59264.1 ribonuclease HI large subunit [Cordyceps fumosorosea ARSEF 2679]